MIDVSEARSYVLSLCHPLPPVELTLAEAVGLVLAAPVVAGEAVPPFANSSMDGFALRSGDVRHATARLRVIAALMAGDVADGLLVGPGEAVRIMTGAPMPLGADAVCMIERTTDAGGGEVIVEGPVKRGANVRPAGDDVAPGQELFGPGEQIRPAHIGLLSSAGAQGLLVRPRPRVGVVSTGDELVTAPGPLPAGKIRDSNRPALLAQLRSDGFEAVDLGHADDDAAALAASIELAASQCDAVITSGGVSVGDRDLVKLVLDKLGGETARWLQVAVKPAKPFAFSVFGSARVPLFGLPGNPVSALISYELFARPALRLMAGHIHLGRPVLQARAAQDMARSPDGKLHLLRVVLSAGPDGELQALRAGHQGSHQMLAMARCNALALLPDGRGVRAGEKLSAWLLDAGSLSSGPVSSGDQST